MTRVDMNQNIWKKLVKDQANKKESDEWIATKLLYRSLSVFDSTGIDCKNGFKWWKLCKWYPMVLYKVKVMLRLVLTNNVKCGYICSCNEEPNAVHILFECQKNMEVREERWEIVKRKMPTGMRNSVQSMTDIEKFKFIYSGFNDSFCKEWTDIEIEIVDFIYQAAKTWYSPI